MVMDASRKEPRITLIQGPNLHFLGRREPEKYGKLSARALDELLMRHANTTGFRLSIFYTNSESAAIDHIYNLVERDEIDGLVMNPAAWSDSVSPPLNYCIKAVKVPYVEVHIRNQYQRNIMSSLGGLAFGVIQGFGNPQCYLMGLSAMHHFLVSESPDG